MSTLTLAALLGALALALIHALSPLHRGLSSKPRSPVLSFAGGVATSFVLLRLLPSVADGSGRVERLLASGPLAVVARPAFATVVLSLLFFYALYRVVKNSRERRQKEDEGKRSSLLAFWSHMPAYAALNMVIGYLLLEQVERGWKAVLLFFAAKSNALLVLDHAFFDDHWKVYDRIGRWLVTAAIPAGWLLRYAVDFPEVAPVLMQAVLGGAVLLNMLAEEFPPSRQSRVWPFALGAVLYGVLLSALEASAR